MEVKGRMTEEDADKIYQFSGLGEKNGLFVCRDAHLVVAGIPDGTASVTLRNSAASGDITVSRTSTAARIPLILRPLTGNYFAAHPGINKNGKFELFGDDSSYTEDRDDAATLAAFRRARQARFEHGRSRGGAYEIYHLHSQRDGGAGQLRLSPPGTRLRTRHPLHRRCEKTMSAQSIKQLPGKGKLHCLQLRGDGCG